MARLELLESHVGHQALAAGITTSVPFPLGTLEVAEIALVRVSIQDLSFTGAGTIQMVAYLTHDEAALETPLTATPFQTDPSVWLAFTWGGVTAATAIGPAVIPTSQSQLFPSGYFIGGRQVFGTFSANLNNTGIRLEVFYYRRKVTMGEKAKILTDTVRMVDPRRGL